MSKKIIFTFIFVVFVGPLACSAQAQTMPTGVNHEKPVLPPGGRRAAANLEAEVMCDEVELRKGIVRLSWAIAENQGSEQRVAITIYRDGFETGNYEISKPLSPHQPSLEWDHLKGQAIHLWRVLTLQPEGWAPSVTARFEGLSCVADFVSPPKPSE